MIEDGQNLEKSLKSIKKRPKLGNDVDVSLLEGSMAVLSTISADMGSVVSFHSKKLGRFYAHMLKPKNARDALDKYAAFCKEKGFGLVEVVKFTDDEIVVHVEENALSYHLRGMGKVCYFISGIISGLLTEADDGRKYYAVESKCYANGDECCEFIIRPMPKIDAFALALKEVNR